VVFPKAGYTISTVGWGVFEAKTVCKQKGYTSGTYYPIKPSTGATNQQLQLTFDCNQQMSKIELCSPQIKLTKIENVAGVFCFSGKG
jgi:hypothetical protein